MAEKLKELFFTERSIEKFADSIKKSYPDFDEVKFSDHIYTEEWDDLELKQKMRHVTLALQKVLPEDFAEACKILKEAAPGIKGFEAMSLPDFTELFGMDDFETSLDALHEFTKYSSSEFAIRPFIMKYPEKTMKKMVKWSTDTNANVRRFSSEGCRPRLPWAMALTEFKKDPSPIIQILENLKDDDSEFVRRSVANNLNDISKDNPDIMLEVCRNWYGTSERTDWIIKHACRSLLKSGNKNALSLFGYGDPRNIRITDFQLDKRSIKIGDYQYFSFILNINEKDPVKTRVEYRIDFVKANGKLSGKVFKIAENTFKPGIKKYEKKHLFADMSTRKHYPGKHIITVIINGDEKGSASFELTK